MAVQGSKARCPERGKKREQQLETVSLFMIQSWKSCSITSTSFCLLEVSHQGSPISRGEQLDPIVHGRGVKVQTYPLASNYLHSFCMQITASTSQDNPTSVKVSATMAPDIGSKSRISSKRVLTLSRCYLASTAPQV